MIGRPRQESETKYRIVVDTVFPHRPYNDDKALAEWMEVYGPAFLLSNYEGRDFSSKSPIKGLITSCTKGGRHGNWGKLNEKSDFKFHIEKAEVVWDWVDVDL